MPSQKSKHHFFNRKSIIFILLISIITIIAIFLYRQKLTSDIYQDALLPFYTPPAMTNDLLPGQIIRQQPLASTLSSGKAYRILYVSQLISAGKTFSSGIIFIPNQSAPKSGRKIIAWAHGTIGMGDSCAPSRNPNFMNNLSWIDQMMQQNFVVTATDYSGLGTPGTERYLLGSDQALDVLNSVKAAANFPNSSTSKEFAIWGHSQGGQAVLFAAHLASKLLPSYRLVGVVAAAPAAELIPLIKQQNHGVIPWIIASEIATAWPLQYATLNLDQTLTPPAQKNYQQIANECIVDGTLNAEIHADLGQQFFAIDPTTLPAWKTAFSEQTPTPLPPNIPLLIIQSIADQVVLPNTTSLFIQKSCHFGSNLQTLWLNDVTHQNTAMVAGPTVSNWFAERFQNKPISNSCLDPLPIQPWKN